MLKILLFGHVVVKSRAQARSRYGVGSQQCCEINIGTDTIFLQDLCEIYPGNHLLSWRKALPNKGSPDSKSCRSFQTRAPVLHNSLNFSTSHSYVLAFIQQINKTQRRATCSLTQQENHDQILRIFEVLPSRVAVSQQVRPGRAANFRFLGRNFGLSHM